MIAFTCPTLSDRVCSPRAKITCHVRLLYMLSKGNDGMPRPTFFDPKYVIQGRLWHVTHDVFRSCVLTKGESKMSRLTLSDHECCLMEIMAFHARRHPNVCAAQEPCGHAMHDVVHLCVLDTAMITCHARRCPTAYVI